MKGMVKKITLENFITYENVELIPGKKMNLIVGPNGSGKSTILCALCLGLAGKPKSIGRCTKLADYVKTGCNEASIQIELEDGNHTVVVSMVISSDGGRTTWAINGRQTSTKQIEEFMTTMNISMDNLCQFLSQERVQEFSKMNPQLLLQHTEKTVGSQDMITQHTTLIDLSKSSHKNEKSLANINTSLVREIQRCDQLKVKVDAMKEYQAILDKVTTMKLKKPWIKYNEHVASMKEMQDDLTLATNDLKDRKKEVGPLEKEINTMKAQLAALAKEMRSKSGTPGQALQASLDAQDNKLQAIQTNQRNLNEQRKEEDARVSELTIAQNQLISIEKSIADHQKNFNAETNQRELHEVNTSLAKLDSSIQKLFQTRQSKTLVGEYDREMSEKSKEKNRLASADQQRWEQLKRTDADAHKASLYLRDHKGDYQGLVYPAIVLEISMTRDHVDGRYLEMLISRQDKKALLCELTSDMNKLVPLLKEQLHCKINMLNAPNEPVDYARTQVSRQELTRYGFDCYLTDLFTCPLPIMYYLCKSRNLQQIPVAFSENNLNVTAAQQKFNRFFAGNKFYTITRSRYTGNVATRVTPITDFNSFSTSVDQARIAALENRLDELQALKDQHKRDIEQMNQELRKEEQQKEKLRKRRQELKTDMDQLKSYHVQKTRCQARIDAIHKQAIDLDVAETKCREANKKLVKELVVALDKLNNDLRASHELEIKTSLLAAEERTLRLKHNAKENKLREFYSKLRDLEKQIEDLKKMVDERKRTAQRLFREARDTTNGNAPGDPGFAGLEDRFQEFPDNVQELDCAIRDAEGRLEFFGRQDENIVEEYQKQLRTVEDLRRQQQTNSSTQQSLKTDMQRIKEQWLPSLKRLAKDISEKYERLFTYMDCVGEVQLVEGTGDNDFENYGLSIRVKFRPEEPLRELGSAQSGGERSVSTAIYLLALQELTTVPFRCMDEINQGMDPTNERRIMNLMMKMSESEDSCQYFVVTPKLLPDLRYSDSTKMMFVSQPKRLDSSKWTMVNFLYRAKKLFGYKRARHT